MNISSLLIINNIQITILKKKLTEYKKVYKQCTSYYTQKGSAFYNIQVIKIIIVLK